MKDRDATIVNYANAVVDDMDLKTLCAFAIDTIVESLDDYSDKELIQLCNEYQDGLVQWQTAKEKNWYMTSLKLD